MKTPPRLEHAISKLYRAYHEDTLQPECCKQCAVGNILDNTDAWRHLAVCHGSTQLSYVGVVHQRLGRTFQGYTPVQLLEIERVFLSACGYTLPLGRSTERPSLNKEMLFDGLCAVVAYLCQLEGVANVMDYSKLFETHENRPKFPLLFS